jgi:hypothetical protein
VRADSSDRSVVTLVVDFERDSPHTAETVHHILSELAEIWGASQVKLDWRALHSVAPSENFEDLIVVKFTGSCQMDFYPHLLDERGPLAYTHVTDGRIQPFAEVRCDKVKDAIRGALTSRRDANRLLGRALGRVLSHELYHIVTNNPGHSRKGVAKERLSARDLLAPRLRFDRPDLPGTPVPAPLNTSGQ